MYFNKKSGDDMKVIPPIEITQTNIITSTLLEPSWATTDYAGSGEFGLDYPPVVTVGNTSTATLWDKTAAYTINTVVYVDSLWRMYQCMVAVSAGTDNTRPDRDTTAWADAGPYEVVWQSATAVPVLTRRIRRETHRTYISLRAITTGDTTPPEDAPTVWQDIGPTNAWAIFDTYRNTQCVVPRGDQPVSGLYAPTETHAPGWTPNAIIDLKIQPGKRVDSLALTGLEASQITVSILDSTQTSLLTPVIVTRLHSRPTATWSDYFFGVFRSQKSYIFTDIPMYSDAVISINLINEAGPVRCGSLVLGRGIYMGDVQYGARSGATNFSKVERDEYGNSALIQRRSVPKFSGRMIAASASADVILDLRDELNAVPAVYVGLEKYPEHSYYESAVILGIYKQLEVDMQYPEHIYIDFEVEEI